MIAGRLWEQFLNFALPRQCPACGTGYEWTPEDPRSVRASFCGDCDREMRDAESAARCGYCAAPLPFPGSPCGHCLGNGLPLLEKIVCLSVLKDPLKTAIHRAKYEHRWPVAERLADRLRDRSDVQMVLEQAEVLVPVPLHPRRQRERGYNQAELIAGRLAKTGSGGLRVVNAARRIKPTDSQTHLHSREKRAENLRGAFELSDPGKIRGKHVVLVDDVLTTGETMLSLARTLKPAAPASFCSIVLAVADPKGRAFEMV